MALQGNLSEFKLEEIIQSISVSNKSGKLEVDGVMGMYGIYFSNGQIVRCLVILKRTLSNVLKIIAVPVDIAKQWPYNSKW